MSKGYVYITGGGPGNPLDVTLRAVKALQNCDAVLYDDLVSAGLLKYCRPGTEEIYVGKRTGKHSMKQSEICAKNMGSPEYWETSVNLPLSPRTIAEGFAAQFSGLLDSYTRYPLERVMAYAFAAIELLRQSEKAMKKERALEILAEYGWRTSHFIA